MVNVLDKRKVEQIVGLFRLSYTIRQISAKAGVSKLTVSRYYKIHGPFRCECGRDLTHRGWCPIRISRSQARLDYLSGRRPPAPKPKPKAVVRKYRTSPIIDVPPPLTALDITHALLGDPPPGRSALDRRGQGEV